MVSVCSRYCPQCLGPAKVTETNRTSNGTRRRRISCLSETCRHRWTEWDGPRPPAGGSYPCRQGKSGAERILPNIIFKGVDPETGRCSPEAVHFLLTHPEIGNREAAGMLGISYTTALAIRKGNRLAHIHPELPRWPRRQPRCSEEKVRFLLTRMDLSNAAAGRAIDLSCEMVRQVRLGISCVNLCPELPRLASRRAPTCTQCEFWSGFRSDRPCAMGLPDPEEEGVAFAADCALFSPAASAGRSPVAAAGSGKPAAD
jgi:hypothetical protein